MTDDPARRLCDLAQDVLDRCAPMVPSSPLVQLTHHAAALLAPDSDDADDDTAARDDIPPAVLDLADEALAMSWYFWPPEEFGASAAVGPGIEELDALRAALEVAWDALDALDDATPNP